MAPGILKGFCEYVRVMQNYSRGMQLQVCQFKNLCTLGVQPAMCRHLRSGPDGYPPNRSMCRAQTPFLQMYPAELNHGVSSQVFKAERPGVPLRVYFLCYEASVEEQKYEVVVCTCMLP